MPRLAYLDCFSGVSGDMLLGAMLDAGLPLTGLRSELAKLPLSGYTVDARKVQRAGLAATWALVDVAAEQPARTIDDITDIIASSSLPEADREKGAAVFRRLAEAEAAVHGEAAETVHLHEVGAADAIVDVMGAIAGLRLLGVDSLYASALPLGEGETAGRHGTLPVPAPATLELLARARAPIRRSDASEELVTPTGAAIVTTLAKLNTRPVLLMSASATGTRGSGSLASLGMP